MQEFRAAVASSISVRRGRGGTMGRTLRGLAGAALGLPLALSMLTGPAQAAPTRSAAQTTAGTQDHRSCRSWMALTFDDGPSHYRTETLQALRRKHVPATFFDVGMRVA